MAYAKDAFSACQAKHFRMGATKARAIPHDISLRKYSDDSSGVELFTKDTGVEVIESYPDVRFRHAGLSIDGSDNLYVAGLYGAPCPELGNMASYNLKKYNSDGELLWGKAISPFTGNECHEVYAGLVSGDVYVNHRGSMTRYDGSNGDFVRDYAVGNIVNTSYVDADENVYCMTQPFFGFNSLAKFASDGTSEWGLAITFILAATKPKVFTGDGPVYFIIPGGSIESGIRKVTNANPPVEVWTRTFPYQLSDYVVSGSDIYVTYFSSNAASVAKYTDIDSGLTLAWESTVGGSRDAIALDSSGNVYVAGKRGQGDGDLAPSTHNRLAASDGSVIWSADHGDDMGSLAVDGDDNVYFFGDRVKDCAHVA